MTTVYNISPRKRTKNTGQNWINYFLFVASGVTIVKFIRSDAFFSEMEKSTRVTLESQAQNMVVDSTSVDEKRPFASSNLERMEMYLERYKYQPPTHYTNHTEIDALCGVNPDYKQWFNQSMKFRSRLDEDKNIYEIFFKDEATRGSVVEMGAYNGMDESNSRFFDMCLGWETLLVEGNPVVWEKLVGNRPQAHRFSYAPSCSEEDERSNKTVPFSHSVFTNAALHIDSIQSSYSQKKRTYDVPCGSLTKVLKDVLNGRVSFFSLDVEGAEPLVVGNIDFNEVHIEIMMIETNNHFCKQNCESRNAFRKIMKNAGYLLFEKMIRKSDVFIHPLSTKYIEKARKAGFHETEWETLALAA